MHAVASYLRRVISPCGECCEADSANAEPLLKPLCYTEGYRSGHNEAVLKTV